ncbi:MAG: response regulator [Desulfobacteraceae bacterium]|nr:response regulator [Desulfobacteraceae bacterium]
MKPVNLRSRINIGILTTSLVIAVVFGAVLLPFEMKRRESHLEKIKLLLISVFEQRKEVLANDIFAVHKPALAETLKEMKVKGVVALSIFNRNGEQLLSTNRGDKEKISVPERKKIEQAPCFSRINWQGQHVAMYSTVIRIDIIRENIGYLKMYYDLTEMEEETFLTMMLFFFLLFITILLMVGLLSLMFTQYVICPVFMLRDAMNKVREGHLGEQVFVSSEDEIGEMTAAFNDMSLKLYENQVALTSAIMDREAYAAKLEQTNEELGRAEEKYRSIFENTIEGIFQTTPAGRFISANSAMARILGYSSPGELIRTVSDIAREVYVYPSDRKHVLLALEKNNSVSDIDIQVLRKNESIIWISLNARTVRDEDGNIICFEGTYEDITERKEAEENIRKYQKQLEDYSHKLEQKVAERTYELREKNEELQKEIRSRLRTEEKLKEAKESAEAASLAKSNFLASMSHEIRTPMNAIIGMTDLTLKTDIGRKQREYLCTIRSSAKDLLGLLNDILDLSKVEAGKLDMKITDFQLRDLVDDLLELFRVKTEEKGIRIIVAIAEDVPYDIAGDSMRLRQILTNLIGNAVKFTEQGEISVHAECLGKSESGITLKFSVRDTGIGIDPEQIETIFDSFTQADSSSTRRYEGTGLGLAICKRLVEMLDGRIGVISEPEKGSLFYFTANFGHPLSEDECEPEQDDTEKLRVRNRFQDVRILLVEDNVINQQVVVEMLGETGAVIDVVNNGKKAVGFVQKTSYDIVLMDIQMPEMDGYIATREIRNLKSEARDVPVIAMTAAAMKGDREKCLQAGMDDFVSKPIDIRELFLIMDRQLENETENSTVDDHDVYSQAEVSDFQIPNALPGIDIEAALKRLEGNRNLFVKLLREFNRDYKDAAGTLLSDSGRGALKRGDTENALVLIHTLKGIAGMFSANDLYTASLELEEEIRHGKTYDIDRLLNNFEKALNQVLESASFFEQNSENLTGHEKQNSDKNNETGYSEAEPFIIEMAGFLKKNSPLAERCLDGIKAHLRGAGFDAEIKLLEAQISKFDFRGAQKTLEHIAESISK